MEEYLPNPNETPTPAIPTNTPAESSPECDRLKVILVSSPKVVNSTIRTLYKMGFAEVTEWSRLQPTPNSNEVMSVLSRNVTIN
jgi:hypothetical protein